MAEGRVSRKTSEKALVAVIQEAWTPDRVRGGRIISVAVIVAVGVNTEGRREIVGLHIGPSEAEMFWSDFLKKLRARGPHGVKLVISDAHEGLKAAISRVMNATWQRCRVRWMRNALRPGRRRNRPQDVPSNRRSVPRPPASARRVYGRR